MNSSQNKRLKLFNKTYREFLFEFGNNKTFTKVKDYTTLETFNKEINVVQEDFMDCKLECLDNIDFIKNLDINKNSSKTFWKYLHNLYFITEDNPEDLINKSKDIISKITNKQNIDTTNMFSNLMSSSSFQSIMNSVATDISTELAGKDVNPQTLMTDLLGNLLGNSNTNSSGINIGKILQDTQEKLKTEIDNGNIVIPKKE